MTFDDKVTTPEQIAVMRALVAVMTDLIDTHTIAELIVHYRVGNWIDQARADYVDTVTDMMTAGDAMEAIAGVLDEWVVYLTPDDAEERAQVIQSFIDGDMWK